MGFWATLLSDVHPYSPEISAPRWFGCHQDTREEGKEVPRLRAVHPTGGANPQLAKSNANFDYHQT